MISVDLTEKEYIGSMISVDPPKNTNSRGSFDKMKRMDLWSHRIPDPDPLDQILGSIFGIHEHVWCQGHWWIMSSHSTVESTLYDTSCALFHQVNISLNIFPQSIPVILFCMTRGIYRLDIHARVAQVVERYPAQFWACGREFKPRCCCVFIGRW